MKFSILEPTTILEAVELLDRDGEQIRILAGGTDLLVKLKTGVAKPPLIMSLQKIKDFISIEYAQNQGLRIGPLVTHAEIAAHPEIKSRYAALATACSLVGSPQIRNLGTLAGNVANASPAADTAPALLIFGAELVVRGVDGIKRIGISEFYQGPGQTALRHTDMIEEIFIPEPSPATKSVYLKLGRRKAMEIAVCGVAMAAAPRHDKWINARLALGAVAPTPVLAVKAGSILENQIWLDPVVAEGIEAAQAVCSPIDDQRASANYRRLMVEVLVKRAIANLCLQREEGENA